jgi:hypothetical protein
MEHLSPEMTNHPDHDALDVESISLLDQNRFQSVIRRMQLNRFRFAIVGLDRGLAIHQGNDGLPVPRSMPGMRRLPSS